MVSNVLVTGGAGYVGSHACKALSRAGFTPVVLDDLSSGHRDLVKWGPFEHGSTGDGALVRRLMRKYQPLAIMHFAAASLVQESVTNPAKYYQNNLVNTANLLDQALECGVNKIVFSSTCATYGTPESVPISEETPQSPINPYGRSKLMVEHLMQDYDAAYGLRFAALRYFNAAGADPECETGEDHPIETHLIPLALAAAAGWRGELSMFGTDWPTPDGTCIRDYVHVTDLAQWHVSALQHLLDGKDSIAVNLGTGKGHSVREVVDSIAKVTGMKVPLREADRRAGDPASLVANPTKAKAILGAEAKYSDMDHIIKTAWAFMQARRLQSLPRNINTQSNAA